MTQGLRRVRVWPGLTSVLWILAAVTAIAGPIERNPTPEPHSDPGLPVLRALLGGPAVLLLMIGSLAILALVSAFFQRSDGLARLLDRAANRLEHKRLEPTLWGFAAGFGLVIATTMLGKLQPLILFALGVGALFFALGGLGLGAVGLYIGRRLSQAFSGSDLSDLGALGLGVGVCFFCEWIPFVGWAVVFLSVCAGAGSILGVWATRGLDSD